ncbi:MAG: hypothetical protein ACREL2_09030, partial [Gemmatimonadales bacterium]
MRYTLATLAVLLFRAATPGWARQVNTLLPVDEARRDPSLTVFRAKLVRAVETRDTAFVLSVLAPNVTNSFGGDGGVDEFRHRWQLAAGGPQLWATLHDILTHGGSFLNDSLFEAPYWS